MATKTFQTLLMAIQTSGLNFKMEISAFSATICIKNSFIKDKNGNPVIQSSQVSDQSAKMKSEQASNLATKENVIKTLEADLEDAMHECEKVRKINDHLESAIDALHSKLETTEATKRTIANSESEITLLKQEIKFIETKNEDLRRSIHCFNKELNESKAKATKEMEASKKEYKAELKFLRKELGTETSEKLKLEAKLYNLMREMNAKDVNKKNNDKGVSNECETVIEDDKNFTCTICAETYLKSELSSKSEPEECDTCKGCNSEDDQMKVKENDSKNSDVEEETAEDSLIQTVVKEFGDFLENFTDDDGSHKYQAKVTELVKLSEHILDVSCTDIRTHNGSLRRSLEMVGLYVKAFPQLCRTIKAYVETKVGPEAAKKDYLLRLVI